MRVEAQNGGRIALLYRAATQMVHRDTYLLQSTNGGDSFTGQKLHEWNPQACPMSSFVLIQGAKTTWAAWESRKQIYFSALDAGRATREPQIQSAPGEGANRKYPVMAVGKDNHLLLAWTENTAWNRGGSVKFQLHDANQKSMAQGTRDDVPAWSFAAVFPRNDGTFTVLY